MFGTMILWLLRKHAWKRNMTCSSLLWDFDISDLIEKEAEEVEELLYPLLSERIYCRVCRLKLRNKKGASIIMGLYTGPQ